MQNMWISVEFFHSQFRGFETSQLVNLGHLGRVLEGKMGNSVRILWIGSSGVQAVHEENSCPHHAPYQFGPQNRPVVRISRLLSDRLASEGSRNPSKQTLSALQIERWENWSLSPWSIPLYLPHHLGHQIRSQRRNRQGLLQSRLSRAREWLAWFKFNKGGIIILSVQRYHLFGALPVLSQGLPRRYSVDYHTEYAACGAHALAWASEAGITPPTNS